jgi:glucose dehydrogenase
MQPLIPVTTWGDIHVLDRVNSEPLAPVQEPRASGGGVVPNRRFPAQTFLTHYMLASANLTKKGM